MDYPLFINVYNHILPEEITRIYPAWSEGTYFVEARLLGVELVRGMAKAESLAAFFPEDWRPA